VADTRMQPASMGFDATLVREESELLWCCCCMHRYMSAGMRQTCR
jgi:hypothetical protein